MNYNQIINSVAFVATPSTEPLAGIKVTHVPTDGFEVFLNSEALARIGSTRIDRIVRIGNRLEYKILFRDCRMGVMTFTVNEELKLLAYKTTVTEVDLEPKAKADQHTLAFSGVCG